MSQIMFDEKFIEKLKNIFYLYNEKIPEGLYHYYKDILIGENIETYSSMFSLSKEELIEYARVCKIIEIYKNLTELIDMVKLDNSKEVDNTSDYEELYEELKSEGQYILESITTEEDEEYIADTPNTNMILYSTYIGESINNTANAQSGKGEHAQKNIANLIEQLNKADYMSLRQKGYIHQNQIMGSNKPYYVDGNAFERLGRGSSKVNYIRIPISQNNRKVLEESLRTKFDTLYLVVSFGDFKNEGIDELKYYNKIYQDIKRNNQEVIDIINLFKKDFNKDTFIKVMDIIEKSFKITSEITSIIKNKKN